MWQGQALGAAQPGQARKQLFFTAGGQLPATQGVEVLGLRDLQLGPWLAAQDDVVKARNDLPCEADGHLVTGANIQLLPAFQGANADAADFTVVEQYRRKLQ